MPVLRLDSGRRFKAQRLDNGFLKVPATFGAPGVVTYQFPNGTSRRELRTAEELFKKDSMATAELLTVTMEHPAAEDGVSAANVKKVSIGSGGDDIRRDGDEIQTTLLVNDQEAISAILRKDGPGEVSPGYYVDLDLAPGNHPEFGPYDAVQKNIRYNHIAVVQKARGGPKIALHLDSADGVEIQTPARRAPMEKITINGLEYEVEAAVAQAYRQDSARQGEAVAEAAKVVAERDALKDDLAKECKLREDSENPSKVQEAIKARLELVSVALPILKQDSKDVVNLSDEDLRKAVVVAVRPGLKERLLNADSAYVAAAFDIAVEGFEEGPDESLGAVHKAALNTDTKDLAPKDMSLDQLREHNRKMREDSTQSAEDFVFKAIKLKEGV